MLSFKWVHILKKILLTSSLIRIETLDSLDKDKWHLIMDFINPYISTILIPNFPPIPSIIQSQISIFSKIDLIVFFQKWQIQIKIIIVSKNLNKIYKCK